MQEGISTARLDLASEERFVPLRRELEVTSFGLNLLVLQPGARGRIHRHERQEEVYLVLDGTLTLALEDSEHDFEVGELVRVAPDVRRQLVNRRRQRLALLALGGYGEHEGRDGVAFTSWEDTTGASPREMPWPDDLPESELRD
jgi:mannose-6-phosphate isomerase-like protein (cupin superfamily)